MPLSRVVTHIVAPLAAAFACTISAQAALINLSTHSSDETPASVLNATLDFSISGSTLTLTVTNTTSAPNLYFMNEVYFNGGPGVTGLSMITGPTGWNLFTNQAADGFGVFQYGLIDGVGSNPATIAPGETLVWTFSISGSAVDTDFTSYLSTIPPGQTPAIVAGKWIAGPDDDSAFGATVPGPGAIMLLAGGLLATRRRPRA